MLLWWVVHRIPCVFAGGFSSPALYDSKEFGSFGVSISRRSNMDPPTSSRSSEYERYNIIKVFLTVGSAVTGCYVAALKKKHDCHRS